VHLTDGRNQSAVASLPLRVELPERPRRREFVAEHKRVPYQLQGETRRNRDGAMTQVVVVVAPFGSPPDPDQFWPRLVGPQSAIDLTRKLVVTFGTAVDERNLPLSVEDAATLLQLALRSLRIEPIAVIGAASYGAEVVLSLLSSSQRIARECIVIGGHAFANEEPSIRKIAEVAERSSGNFWGEVAPLLVDYSYTPQYFEVLSNGEEHDLRPVSPQAFQTQLTDKMASYFASKITAPSFRARMHALIEHPVALPARRSEACEKVTFVANRADRIASPALIERTRQILERAGLQTEEVLFSDDRGHSAFFGNRLPSPLELAVEQALNRGSP
jgi:homoserine acetyltransferase